MKKLLLLLLLASPAFAQTHTFPALDTNNAFTGTNTMPSWNSVLTVDGTLYATVAAAVTAAGSVNKTLLILPSTFGGTCPAGTLPSTNPNIIIWDFSGRCNNSVAQTPASYNGISFNNNDGNVFSHMRSNWTQNTLNASGAMVNGYFITLANGLTVGTGTTVDGISAECDLVGNLTGTLANCTAAEHNISVQSALGTVTNAFSGVFAAGTFNSSGNCFGSANCTAVTNMGGGHFFGCRAPLGAVPVNCYGAFFEDQLGRASGRNYSAAFMSKLLLGFSGNQNAAGEDCEDHLHVTHTCFYVDGSDFLNVQAVSASGIEFLNSAAGLLGTVTASGLRSGGFSPLTTADLGFTNLPFANLWLGTAGTNNFKFQPGATAGARVISIPDPGVAAMNLGMSYNTVVGSSVSKRGTAGCTTAVSIGGTCATPVTVTWGVTLPNSNYSVVCQGTGAITNFPIMGSVTARNTTTATVQTMALTAAAASFATIDCMAILD